VSIIEFNRWLFGIVILILIVSYLLPIEDCRIYITVIFADLNCSFTGLLSLTVSVTLMLILIVIVILILIVNVILTLTIILMFPLALVLDLLLLLV